MIELAKNKDYSFLTSTINNAIGTQFNASDFINLGINRNTGIISVNHKDQQPVLQAVESESPTKPSQITDNNTVSRKSPNSNIYYVTKRCAGAVSKEADKRYTKYATQNNTDGIQMMLLSGELVVLNDGEEVVMLDLGYLTSKIKTKSGEVLYVDTENLSK